MLRSNHSRRRSLHLLAAPLRFRRPFPSGSGAAYSASAAAQDRSSRKTLVYLLSMVGAMVGASYAAVLCPTVRRNTHRRRHHRAPPLSSPHRIAAVTHHSVALLRRAIAISVAAPRRRHLRRRAVPCRTIAVVVAALHHVVTIPIVVPHRRRCCSVPCRAVAVFVAVPHRRCCLAVLSSSSHHRRRRIIPVFVSQPSPSPLAAPAHVYANASPMVMSVLDDYNVCIFAYGQTGTGKTFTMEGTFELMLLSGASVPLSQKAC